MLCLWALAACSLCLLQTPAGGQGSGPAPKTPRVYYGTVPDTGQFLPDTTVLARVEDKVIRVRDFVETYYSSYAEFRPRPDSLGRVQFLQSMIDKEVLAKVARRAGRQESFEERLALREHTERVLSNVLFQRAVYDSVPPLDEKMLMRVHRQMGRELHLQQIVCPMRDLAEKARKELVERKISWKDAVKRYSSIPPDSLPDGDRGWLRREALEAATALAVFDLAPHEISTVMAEGVGYSIYRVAEERSVKAPPAETFRNVIGDEYHKAAVAERSERILAQMRARTGMVHDTASMIWTASRFSRPYRVISEGRPTLEINNTVPHFAPEDTARVLATYDRGRITLGDMLSAYEKMSVMTRPNLTTLEAVQRHVDVIALEPRLVELALARGLDRDTLAIALIEKRREELMVERLYQDSIMTKVWVSAAERRKYYDDHPGSFTTYPTVHFALFHAGRKSDADSLAARLRGGEQAMDILRADSLAGIRRGSIEQRRQSDQGTAHYKLLFEELRPPQVSVVRDGVDHFDVIQSIEYDPGRLLPYEEAESLADESMQNEKAEALFKELLARHRARTRIAARPELVMLVRLTPPS